MGSNAKYKDLLDFRDKFERHELKLNESRVLLILWVKSGWKLASTVIFLGSKRDVLVTCGAMRCGTHLRYLVVAEYSSQMMQTHY
jgi:hypothetical protein